MKKLIAAAISARIRAYAPYSRYKVGAAILADNGKIYTGCNVENASYGLTVCAERVALFNAVADGARKFKSVAIVTGDKVPATPCGACRQVLHEFAPNIEIILANEKGAIRRTNLKKLLPKPFG